MCVSSLKYAPSAKRSDTVSRWVVRSSLQACESLPFLHHGLIEGLGCLRIWKHEAGVSRWTHTVSLSFIGAMLSVFSEQTTGSAGSPRSSSDPSSLWKHSISATTTWWKSRRAPSPRWPSGTCECFPECLCLNEQKKCEQTLLCDRFQT